MISYWRNFLQETMNKLVTYIGFSMKSNAIVFGQDNILKTRKKQHLVVLCSTVNEKAINSMHAYCEKQNITLVKLQTQLLSNLVKRDNVKFVSFTNEKLATQILANLQEYEMIKRGNL